MPDFIQTPGAPAALGPYSQAVADGSAVFCSGQIGLDPAGGRLVDGGVGAQTRRALANLAAVLEAAGCGLDAVVKTTVYLVSMDDFDAMNAEYAAAFGTHRPARSTVAVSALPKGAAVEVEATALRAG